VVFSFCALVSKSCQYRLSSPVKSLKDEIIYKTAFSNILKIDMICDRPEQATVLQCYIYLRTVDSFRHYRSQLQRLCSTAVFG